MNHRYLLLLSIFAYILFGLGCELDNTPVATDPRHEGAPPPQITAIEPPEWWFGGVDKVTIHGNNFMEDPDKNVVFFNDKPGIILSARSTRLEVRPPLVFGDSIKVRVGTAASLYYSNIAYYALRPAVQLFGTLIPGQRPRGITVDKEGNLYVSMATGSPGTGIKKLTPDGTQSDYAPAQPWHYVALRMGPDGYLYAARELAIIYRVPPGGGAAATWRTLNFLHNIRDFDFDSEHNIWAGGNNPVLYRVAPDQSLATFPFEFDVRAVRVFDGYLYMAIREANNMKIVRRRIISKDELGEVELYFAFTQQYGNPAVDVTAMEIASDGTLFLGTNGPDPMIIVEPDGSWERLYPGLMNDEVYKLVWGTDTYLYQVRNLPPAAESHRMLKINTLRQGAPYYGLQ